MPKKTLKVDDRPAVLVPKTLSLRDYFAAQALSGLCARFCPDDVQMVAHAISKASYDVADALLKVRKEQ
jgi:hypothetical protein